MEIAKRLNAAAVNPKAMDGAQIAFGKAMAARGDKKVMADQARVAPSWPPRPSRIPSRPTMPRPRSRPKPRDWRKRAALENRATTAESESARIARELREVQIQREALASESANLAKQTETLTAERDAFKAERDKVAADREAIKKERDELAGMLKGALSSVADTTETARGVVVSLSGILFDVGKATLAGLPAFRGSWPGSSWSSGI